MRLAAIRDAIARLVILAAIAASGFALVYAAALIPGINAFAAAIAICLVVVYSMIRSRRRRRAQARLTGVPDAAADAPKPEGVFWHLVGGVAVVGLIVLALYLVNLLLGGPSDNCEYMADTQICPYPTP